MRPILWMSDPLATAVGERLGQGTCPVKSVSAFLDEPRDDTTVSFVDGTTLAELDRVAAGFGGELIPSGPVIAVCDAPLQTAISWLPTHPWLSHIVSASMLKHPMATEHLGNVMDTLTSTDRPTLSDWLSPSLTGRRVRLTQASRRLDRLERLGEFFQSKGFGARTIQQLRDAAEELLTNAFYDAPAAAGAVSHPIRRTQDVLLPEDCACELVYGCSDNVAIIRVRDPFGSLSRSRIVDVLTRCARSDMQVEVDETMGGAGLGLWRIFSVCSFVAVSVVGHHHTDFLVGIGKRVGPGPRPFAFHFFFKEGVKRRYWSVMPDEASLHSVSVTFTAVDEPP